jgi:hypothetical protein
MKPLRDVAVISADVMLKTIVGHFFGDRDAYMTTKLPGINGYIPDTVMISGSGSSPGRGTSVYGLSHLLGRTVATTRREVNFDWGHALYA